MRPSGIPRPHQREHADIQSLLREACAAKLPAWLETRRWFADKGRGIAGVGIEAAIIERVESDWLAFAVARVAFDDGRTARYLLPLAFTESAGAAEDVRATAPGPETPAITDATEKGWFGGWLLDRFDGATDTARGAWDFASQPEAGALFAAARGSPATVMRAEQSNSSIRFGDSLIVKLFRRLQPGPNPENEVLRTLANAGFDRVPFYAGDASWRSSEGETFAVVLAQGFVPNMGDGWSWMLQRLDGVAAGVVDPAVDEFAAERLLGQRTGELHVALGGVAETGFMPVLAGRAATDADARRTRAAIDETIALLRGRQASLPAEMRTRMPAAVEGLGNLATRADGFRDEVDTHRIRVHGDYHLGQTLRTPDGDWTIIDFEGEPARPIDERRQKASALKDVAGMLRSFAYARGAAERAAGVADHPAAKSRLLAWDSGARRAFLEGYRQALAATAVSLVPDEDTAFHRALAAWELDKALYEVAYEARNRPDWLALPLRALLPDLLDQTVDTAGGAPA